MQRRGGMVYLALVAIIVGAALHTSAERASACSCAPPRPPFEALARADAVFSGEVVSMKEPRGWLSSSTDPITIEFKVSAVWKGDIHETVFIKTAWSSASCGYEFALGEQYLVYAREGRTSLCSRTKSIHAAIEDFAALGGPTAHLPGANRQGLFGPAPLYGVIGLAAIGLLGVTAAFMLWRRSRS